MESRHDLGVDHTRLLTGYMDPQGTGQMRPPYGDLCRPPGTDASTLYHSRYLPSMPISTGSSFPFLGGMFTGPPTSPFRTPSTPGVNNMRQFWPPTPPPDGGYGRYSMNANLFPLFGAPSPDNGAFLTQGLVSRLGSSNHLSPLIDHKEHSFFSHGIGLGTPLTPTSHVASPSPFPHLIPSLERHPAYGGHMTLGGKELEELADDSRLMKSHLDCLMKQHDIPSSRQDRPKSKNDAKHCCDKAGDECCKLACENGNNSRLEHKHHGRQPTSKVHPCKIEVSHSPALKPDMLSPPIESPGRYCAKKSSHSPFEETRCSQCCCAATKPDDTGPHEKKSSSNSPVITAADVSDKPSFDQSSCKSGKNSAESPSSKSSHSPAMLKHVTAAVIPTAPKQMVHRDIHPETEQSKGVVANCEQSVFMKEQNGFCADNSVKLELVESAVDKSSAIPNNFSNSTNGLFLSRPLSKNPSTSCKVKDMIKNNAKQLSLEKVEDSSSKNSELDSNPAISSNAVTPTVVSSPCKSNGKYVDNNISPFKEDTMKSEGVSSRLDCEFTQKNSSWTKATVSPFNWQGNSPQDDQAINLTVSKKIVKPEPIETIAVAQTDIKIASENSPNSGVIGVCHPNPTPIAINKIKATPAMSSISNFASISVLNQPAEQSTEVHILHRSSKSSFQSPVPLKSTISHVTANTSIHRSLKTEQRLTTKRGKISEMDKMGGRTTLATLAPKLSKNVNFGKDVQTSHTISASSSVSSTSIVFPATVNPCIPVGIAIAQQRQDSSTAASIGKPPQPSVPSTTPNLLSSNPHLSTNRVTADLQNQEIMRDSKGQDLSNNPAPVDANLLVTQGPTIVSRQWESEALTRTALPSSWVAHGSIVAPAVWLGQGAYTAPASNAVAMSSLESSPISLPPGGYQLARDSITGHLLLIPTANIELMDRPSVWPAFNSSAPIQQLVTQQQHTQFEQVLPQADSLKTNDGIDTSCNITTCDISSNTAVKTEEKMEESGQVPSVPLATGQTYAFTTFPTQCDPAGFSYVLQSSTVMHLAHTQTTASIQTESGRRSQATSPLHCASPSPPPPNTYSVQASVTEDEEESENESECEAGQVQVSVPNESVTTAIQVDMDSQTNSEEDEDEDRKVITEKTETLKVEMSDSANQTESVSSESPKSELDTEDIDMPTDKLQLKDSQLSPKVEEDVFTMNIKEDSSPNEPGLEIVTSETELAPSLPVESKPVMDFIDHHGLNLLVDSIEEFASREQEASQTEIPDEKTESTLNGNIELKSIPTELKTPEFSQTKEIPQTLPPKSFPTPYKTIDTTCTDGLGLLCALAEQRFFEEALNDDSKTKSIKEKLPNNCSEEKRDNLSSECSVMKENSFQSNSNESSAQSSVSSSPSREATEMEMRLQIEELQKKYKQKQRELELLRNKKERENSDEEIFNNSSPPKTKKVLAPLKPVPVSHPKSPVVFTSQNISSNFESKSKMQLLPTPCSTSDSNCSLKQNDLDEKNNVDGGDSNKADAPNERVPPIATPAHDSSSSHSGDSNSSSSDSSSNFSERSSTLNENLKVEKPNSEERKNDSNLQEQEFDKNDKSKTPFFDEQAWFVRRSERIFLSDARSTASSSTPDKNNRKHANSSSNKGSSDVSKEKKEHTVRLKTPKSDDVETKKNKKVSKPKLVMSKKRSLSVSSDSGSSSDDDSSEVESSDAASSTSENLPLSTFVEQSSSNKATLSDRQKRLSTDSECSSGHSEDIPLSVLMEHKVQELKSCILKPEDLQENARLLVLDEGLFYAGYITKSEDPDMYGILIDGDRAARPHMFSKEEILNAAVLEVKPNHKLQLPEGSRICAFWSQQYRCLYPGTVTKASSPLPDPSMLYVEFDDGDSGRIPLNDIRMLPSDFPIVSMEPNPFMILGKRRSRAQSQNNANLDSKSAIEPHTVKNEKEKMEHKKQKNPEKVAKKNPIEGKVKSKSKSPSATNRSRSSSKSSINGHSDAKTQNSVTRKENSEDKKKKLEMKSKHSDKKSKENEDIVIKSTLKPKKHKKHKDDHHKHHHHHHHKHHHHKKHKMEKPERPHSSNETVIHSSKITTSKGSSNCLSASEQEYDSFILENSKSDLTMTIKKSPSPHTNLEESSGSKASSVKKNSSISSDEEVECSEPPRKKQKKSKQQVTQSKPSKRKDRVPSVEKSKIAAFLPVRQLWRWSGKSFRRPGAKGKAKKEFYRSIQRGKETIRVGDCAVFLSTGRPHLPYIGRIETMWESWGGKMDVKVKWFYHPEETKSGKKLSQLKGALFQSPHFDENDVQTISHKCEVLSWSEYQEKTSPANIEDNNDTYFLAGTYDPIMGTLILEPGVPNISSSNSSEP